MTLKLYNSLTRQKEEFTPDDARNVRMYVCGPTVYARPHLGNARSVVVYDVLFRLLRHLYGEDHVTYARNITDVDDKINAAATQRGISIQELTREVTAQFHEDMDALNCLRPTLEPTATGHIAEIIAMIEKLIANGNAYEAEGHVLFNVSSECRVTSGEKKSTTHHSPLTIWKYGMLSGRKAEEQEAGARIAVESYKKNPGDFVLWKPAKESDDASSKFDSPWGVGRPGWHIECSAMSTKHLGATFDLHGGGADLMFPHHENEIAQSRCADPHSEFAKTWVHNGFLTVNGEKMSKSLGNFTTVKDVLDKGVHGEVIRFALLSSHYRKPLDWNEKLVEESFFDLKYISQYLWQDQGRFLESGEDYKMQYQQNWRQFLTTSEAKSFLSIFFESLKNDLNFSVSKTVIYDVIDAIKEKAFNLQDEIETQEHQRKYYIYRSVLREICRFLEVATESFFEWHQYKTINTDSAEIEKIAAIIQTRAEAKKAKNWAEADRIRDELKAQGIVLEDRPDGTTDWRRA